MKWREVLAHRQRGRREHPGRVRAVRQRRETRRDVERQQAQREAALRDLDAARAFVLLGMHDGVEPRRRARSARAAHCAMPGDALVLRRARSRARAASRDEIGRCVGERRVRRQPVGPRRRRAGTSAERGQRLLDRAQLARAACAAPARAPARARRARRARSSSTCRLPKRAPKNCVARSGIWCASSRITASAAPSRSPKPSSLSARSASSRW